MVENRQRDKDTSENINLLGEGIVITMCYCSVFVLLHLCFCVLFFLLYLQRRRFT